nr:energy transducer TonB [uncultured Bacteroides sp.]
MKRGKQTCRILKDVRRQIAEANDIEYITSECQYKGDCPGTCPKCEAEIRYLEEQLEHRRMSGKMITLAGLSAGLLSLSPLQSTAQEADSAYISIPYVPSPYVQDTTTLDERDIFGCIETMPEFPDGGIAGLMRYLAKHTKYPNISERNIQGRVRVQFVVDKDGSIHDAKILKSVHPLLDKEALRVVKSMPPWKPGMQRGIAVKVKYIIPVTFKIKDTELPGDSIPTEKIVDN